MPTVRRKRPAANDIVLELRVFDHRVLALLRPPGRDSQMLGQKELPIDRAVVRGIKLAARTGGDVAVIDPYGLWPE